VTRCCSIAIAPDKMTVNKTALVTGGSGLLGREIISAFERKGWKVVGTAHSRPDPPRLVKMDLGDPEGVARILDQVKPAVIVHSAANRSPDGVATDPAAALVTNVHATGRLVEQAAERGIFTLYISTDYVFPGTLPHPSQAPDAVCRTTDKTQPINGYGLTKLKGEEALLAAGRDKTLPNGAPIAAILRAPLLYGHVHPSDSSRDGINKLVEQLENAAKAASSSAEPHVVDFPADNVRIRYPTWTGDVGRVCVDVCDEYTHTTPNLASFLPTRLQFASQTPLSQFDMAVKLCGILGYDQGAFSDPLSTPAANVNRTPDSPIRVVPSEAAAKQAAEDTNSLLGKPVTEEQIMISTARPVHTRLDVSELERIGVSTEAVKFEDWWRRELGAYRK